MKQYLPNIDDFPDAPDPLVDGDYVFESERHEEKTAKDGRTYFKITGRFVNGPAANKQNGEPIDYEGRPFSFVVWPPDASADGDFYESKARKFKEFLKAGNIPWDEEGYDDEDFDNATFGLTLGQQKNSDYKEVKRFFEPGA